MIKFIKQTAIEVGHTLKHQCVGIRLVSWYGITQCIPC
jgi:hypothetical protein